MTRVDELTLALIDGALTDADADELRRLLAEDPRAREQHARLLRLEGALLGEAVPPELAAGVMGRIYEARQQRVVDGVLKQLPARTAPVRARRWTAWALATVALMGAAALWLRGGDRRRGGAATLATVEAAAGVGSVVRGGRTVALQTRMRLASGEIVETGPTATAAILYRRDTRVALGPGTRLALEAPAADAHTLGVTAGWVRVHAGKQAPGRPLVFATPHARATVVGTVLSLTVTARTTHLEVAEGRVLFQPSGRAAELIAAGASAVAGEEPAPPAATDAGVAPATAEEKTILAVDFDDLDPKTIVQGAVVGACPAGSSGGCAAGMLDPWGWSTLVVALEKHPAIAYYAPNLVVAFDYWAADADRLRVQLWNPDGRQNYNARLRVATPGAWAHAEVRIGDARPQRLKDRPWQPGDRIQNIRFIGGRAAGGRPLFIDNVRLYERP